MRLTQKRARLLSLDKKYNPKIQPTNKRCVGSGGGVMKIERDPHNWIAVTDDEGGTIRSQTVLSNLLYEGLQKLEEIRCGIINVENLVNDNIPDWAFRCPFCKIKHETLAEAWACCKGITKRDC